MRLACLVLLVTACGGSGDDDAPPPDAGTPDAGAVSSFADIGAGDVALLYSTGHKVAYEGSTVFSWVGSTREQLECGADQGCITVTVQLPDSATPGTFTCGSAGVTLLVEHAGELYSGAGAGGSCSITLDALGAVGEPMTVTGLGGHLIGSTSSSNTLDLARGAITAVRGDDQSL